MTFWMLSTLVIWRRSRDSGKAVNAAILGAATAAKPKGIGDQDGRARAARQPPDCRDRRSIGETGLTMPHRISGQSGELSEKMPLATSTNISTNAT